MQASEIRAIFTSANVVIPPLVLEIMDPEDEYDDSQSWCCGLDATPVVEGGVLVETYCLRNRAPEKRRWMAYPDGSWKELEPVPVEFWPEHPDPEW